MHTKKIVRIVFLAIIAWVSINVFLASYITPVDFDDSYCLQVAKSLRDSFVYQSQYYPRYIYDFRVTTNGVMQYLAALNLAVFGERIGLSVTLATLTFFAFSVFALYSWRTFAVSLLLVCVYSGVSASVGGMNSSVGGMDLMMTAFLGEITALAFLMLGAFCIKTYQAKHAAAFAFSPRLFGAMVCFGLAISTKLIAVVVCPFILFGLFYDSGKPVSWKGFWDAVMRSAVCFCGAVATFIALYYVSVLHSHIMLIVLGSSPYDMCCVSSGIVQFIKSHFWQQGVQDRLNMLDYRNYANVSIFILFTSSAVFLAYKSRGWIPFVSFCLAVLAFSNLWERRLFLLLVPMVLLAADSVHFVPQTGKKLRGFLRPANLPPILMVLVCCVVLVRFGDDKSLLTPQFERARAFIAAQGENKNRFITAYVDPDIIAAISETKSPVLTSGWWQMPHYQLRLNQSFYDRMGAPEGSDLARLLRKDGPVLLFFNPVVSKHWWPQTSIEMCEDILVSKREVVLCYFNPKYSFNHVWQ